MITAKEILKNAKALSPRDKALVARCLLASLDDPPDESVEEAWLDLARERFDEIKSGKVEALSWETIKNQGKKP